MTLDDYETLYENMAHALQNLREGYAWGDVELGIIESFIDAFQYEYSLVLKGYACAIKSMKSYSKSIEGKDNERKSN